MEQKNNLEGSGMTRVMERNIKMLVEKRLRDEDQSSREQKIADRITTFTGSMSFVYLHLILFGIWISWNAGLFGLKPFDPSFVVLAMFASVEAIFLSTFVLISQNRMNEHAEKRADLNLQISLLAEHEVTRLVTLVKAIAVKMDISEAFEKDIEELEQDVNPEKVMESMENYKAAPDTAEHARSTEGKKA